MNILLCASESLPFCKSGGLGDFIFSYSKALAKLKHNVSVFMPLHKACLNTYPDIKNHLIDEYDFNMSWRNIKVNLYHKKIEGVDFFLVEHEVFNRDGLYGYDDDTYRFGLFIMAANTFITRHNDYDVVHCNDWQSAVLPVLLRFNPKKIKTVLTIHNPAFHGFAFRGDLPDFFNLSTDYFDNGLVRLGDRFSFLKAGVMSADKINTVSITHAKELISDHSGFSGIGAILDWCRHYDFSGIVNGLDVDNWNPSKDNNLPQTYDINNFEVGKKKAKRAILSLLGMDLNFNGPLYAAITRLSNQKGVDRLIRTMNHLSNSDSRMIVIGTGEREDEFLANALNHKEVYFIKSYNEDLAHLLYAAADYFLMPSYFEPCGTSQLISMRYGTVPIVSNIGGLNDTVKDLSCKDEATGFVFNNYDYYAYDNCIIAANELFYHNKELYRTCQVNGMKGDYSWKSSAQKYLELYDSIIK